MEKDEQFCLRWTNHQNIILQNFDTLLQSEMHVDCTLGSADGKYLKAHKLILSACSPYFEKLLRENYDKHPVFIFKDINFKDLEAMLKYMYRGEVYIAQDELIEFLSATDSLQIKGLCGSGLLGKNTVKTNNKLEKRKRNLFTKGEIIKVNSKRNLIKESAEPVISNITSLRDNSKSPTTKRKRLESENDDKDIDTSKKNNETENADDINKSIDLLLRCSPSPEEDSINNSTENIDIPSPESAKVNKNLKTTGEDSDCEEVEFIDAVILDNSENELNKNDNTSLNTSNTSENENFEFIDVSHKKFDSNKILLYKMKSKEENCKADMESKKDETEAAIKNLIASSNNEHECSMCGKSYRLESSLKRHQKYACNNPRRIHCFYCSIRVNLKDNIYKHIRRHHPDKPIKFYEESE